MNITLALIAALAAFLVVWWWSARRQQTAGRAAFIERYKFPRQVLANFQTRHPQLDAAQVRMVERALRSYFLLCLRSDFRVLGMPSNAVDDLWHEFILDTRTYAAFCKRAFGRFLHHIPAGATPPGWAHETSLGRTWRLGCLAEGLDPLKSLKLPMLFGLDSALAIAGGQVHDPAAMTAILQRKKKSSDGGSCGGAGGCAGDASGCSSSGCSGGCGGGGGGD
jgi:hypothetical protein